METHSTVTTHEKKTRSLYGTLISKDQIEKCLEEFATILKKQKFDFERDMTKLKSMVIVCILDGGAFFGVDMLRKLSDSKIEFTKVKTYDGELRVMDPKMLLELDSSTWTDSYVVVLDELVESGKTMKFVYDEIAKNLPKSSRMTSCVMFKKVVKDCCFVPEIIGFHIPDVWTVGYGLDDNGFKREIKTLYWKVTEFK